MSTKRIGMSYKDVLLTFLQQGTDAVADLYKAKKISRETIRLALKKADPKTDTAKLRAWVDAVFGGSRPRSAPEVGEERDYVVQRLPKEGGNFLKVPVQEGLADKGDMLRARFEKDGIKLFRSPLSRKEEAEANDDEAVEDKKAAAE